MLIYQCSDNPELVAALRPLLRGLPRPGQRRPAPADVPGVRGLPLLRRRLQAPRPPRPQARVPLPPAEGEQSIITQALSQNLGVSFLLMGKIISEI